MTDQMDVRQFALSHATRVWFEIPLHMRDVPHAEKAIEHIATSFLRWLNATTTISLKAGPIFDQSTGQQTGDAPQGDTVQIHDNEEFTLSVETEDAKGFATADAVEWTADDNGAVVTLTPSADGQSCVIAAVAPGSAVVTVTDSSANPALTATEAVDVVAGSTATITLTEGPVSTES